MITNRAVYAKKLFQLFWAFFCIAPATFGGGYAIIAVLEKEIVGKRGWLQEEEMGDILSIAGSAPGGVGVNAAAFIGYRLGGIPGSVMTVAGMALPTFVIVFALSMAYSWFKDYPKVIAGLRGVHAAVIGLILVAAFKVAKTALIDKSTVALTVVTLAVLLVGGINPTYVILAGLFAGTLLVKVKEWLGCRIKTEKSSDRVGSGELVYPEYYI